MRDTLPATISSNADVGKAQIDVIHTSNEERPGIQLTDQTNLLPFRKVLVVFLGLACCIIVSALDAVIVATALPTISAAFNAGSVASWVPSATLLTSTAFQPLYGRFSDIFGRKATLCAAMLIFMIGCLAAGLSRSIDELIVFRAISGIGGGGITTMAQVVMSDVVSLRDRGKYQGIIGGFLTCGYAVGPLIGGVLAEKVSWRWCFWVTIPISAIATVVVMFVLPLKPVAGSITRKLMVVDYVGAVLALGGCTLILLPLVWGGVTFSWVSAPVLGTLISGIFVIVLFCLWEWKGARLPIVPMHIFRHSTVTGVYIVMFINGFIFWISLFYISQFFQVALGYSPIRSGISIFPILVAQTIVSFASGVAISRTGRYRTIAYCGFAIWSIACGCLSTLNPTKSKAQQVIFMLLAGTGAGQTLQTTTVAAQASVSRSDMSVVTAVRNFIRFIGGALALAVGSSIINNALVSAAHSVSLAPDLVKQVTDNPIFIFQNQLNVTSHERDVLLAGYISGFRAVFLLNASLAAVAVVIAFVMIHHKELTREDDAQRKEEAQEKEECEMKVAEGEERKLAPARDVSGSKGEVITRHSPVNVS
ncbi:MFS general substrate transporter [Hysterangium stoloniferum]|nr:MFS general substrate transporter [Hysterangium stoloniferum]